MISNISKINILFNEKDKTIEDITIDSGLNYMQISDLFAFLSVKYKNEHDLMVTKIVDHNRKKYVSTTN